MSDRNRVIAVGAGLVLGLVLIWFFWPRGQSEGETRTLLEYLIAAEEEAQWPGLDVETAAATLQTPQDAAQFLRTGVVLQDYAGRHAAPDDVLITRGGNSEDQAMLLQALVAAQGYETRLRVAPWPDGSVPRVIQSARRERPAHDALMAYLEVDRDAALVATRERSAERITRLRQATDRAYQSASAYGASAEVRLMVRPDQRVIVEYRDADRWLALDPVMAGDAVANRSYVDPGQSEVDVRLELVSAQGARRELASMAVSGPQDVTLSFVPSSSLNAYFQGELDPAEISLWRPVLQQGDNGVAGGAFTPFGREAPGFDSAPDYSEPPQVTEIAITDIDLATFPEVALSVQTNAPSDTVWSGAHLTLTDGGEEKAVRVEALPSPPRDITIVTDVSPSMVEASRIFTAGLLGQSLIRQMSAEQSLAAVSVAAEPRVDRSLVRMFRNQRGVDDYVTGLTIRAGDNLAAGVREGLQRFFGPGDLVLLTDGSISDGQLQDLARITADTDSRVFAVVPEGQVERFTPVVDQVFVLPPNEADIDATARVILNASGSRLRLSFLAEPGDGEAVRTLSLAVRDRGVETTQDFVPPKASDGGGRIELSVWRDGQRLGTTRTLIELGRSDTPWRLMSQHKIMVSGGRFDTEAFVRRFYAEERFTYQLALEGEALDVPVGPLLSMLNAAQSVSGYTEQAIGRELVGDDLQVVLFSASPEMTASGEIFLNRTLDLPSDGGLVRAGGARAALAVAEAEAEFLGVESLNASLLAEVEPAIIDFRTAIPDTWPDETQRTLMNASGTLVATADGTMGWLIGPDGALTARLFTPAAKGANARRAAADFRPIIAGLNATGILASGLGSPYGVKGAEVGALFAILDFDARMFCYASVMMGFVADSIEAGGYDNQEDWEGYAAEECGIDPNAAMSAFVGGVAKGAAQGWAGDRVTDYFKGPTGDALTHWGEVGVNTTAGGVITVLSDLGAAGVALVNVQPNAAPSQMVSLAAPPSSGSE